MKSSTFRLGCYYGCCPTSEALGCWGAISAANAKLESAFTTVADLPRAPSLLAPASLRSAFWFSLTLYPGLISAFGIALTSATWLKSLRARWRWGWGSFFGGKATCLLVSSSKDFENTEGYAPSLGYVSAQDRTHSSSLTRKRLAWNVSGSFWRKMFPPRW